MKLQVEAIGWKDGKFKVIRKTLHDNLVEFEVALIRDWCSKIRVRIVNK